MILEKTYSVVIEEHDKAMLVWIDLASVSVATKGYRRAEKAWWMWREWDGGPLYFSAGEAESKDKDWLVSDPPKEVLFRVDEAGVPTRLRKGEISFLDAVMVVPMMKRYLGIENEGWPNNVFERERRINLKKWL